MSKKDPAIIKRDTRINWMKSKYIPEENVIIIMLSDVSYFDKFRQFDKGSKDISIFEGIEPQKYL